MAKQEPFFLWAVVINYVHKKDFWLTEEQCLSNKHLFRGKNACQCDNLMEMQNEKGKLLLS